MNTSGTKILPFKKPRIIKGSHVVVITHDDERFIGLIGVVIERYAGKFMVKFPDNSIMCLLTDNLERIKKSRVGERNIVSGIETEKLKNELQGYVSVTEFAYIKQCYPQDIYNLMRDGAIEIVSIGFTKNIFLINKEKYKGLVCNNRADSEQNRIKFENYYLKHHPNVIRLLKNKQF